MRIILHSKLKVVLAEMADKVNVMLKGVELEPRNVPFILPHTYVLHGISDLSTFRLKNHRTFQKIYEPSLSFSQGVCFCSLVHFYILDRCTRKELKNYRRVFMHATGMMEVDRVKNIFC